MEKFNILTTHGANCNDQRWSEFLFCISENLKNPTIDEIHLALEINQTSDKQKKRLDHLSDLNKKVIIHNISSRPTFKYLFTLCNKTKSCKWIISNGDIYFPKSNSAKLELLLKKDYNKEFFVLTRYNIRDEINFDFPGISVFYDGLNLRTTHGNNYPEGSSIDSWIFETPFDFSKVDFDIQLGIPECDGMMNYQISKIRTVSNPCLSVISIHKHLDWRPWYNKFNFNGRPITREKYRNDLFSKGHGIKKIKFSRLPEDDKPQA